MPTNRRDFLSRLAAGAAVAAVPAIPTTLHAAPVDGPGPFGELEALRRGDSATLAQAMQWDTSWTKKLTGKHKAVFDAPELADGSGVFRAGLWQRQYTDVFKLQPADLSTVIVLRHAAIPLIMNQAFWDEYEIGKVNKLKDEKGKKTNKSPVLISEATGAPASFAALALDRQIEKGAIVLACNMAFAQVVSLVAKKHKLKGAEARAKTLEGMLPGVIMQPSGFFATTLAGENGCVYVRAS